VAAVAHHLARPLRVGIGRQPREDTLA
jgi:hypothetical protein